MYTLSIDGVTTLDPGNSKVLRDGVRRLNALPVPGPGSALYQVGKVPHGTVAAVWYPSPVLKTPRRMLVYTPAGYEGGTRRYPVLYLFHGGGGDEEAWNELGSTSAIMDNLIAQGKAKPMIVVIPNANWNDTSILEPAAPRGQPAAPRAGQPGAAPAAPRGGQPGTAAATTGQDYSVAEREIVTGMIPYVEANYRVLPGRENRAIAGLSMGGGISINVGLKRLDVFATVAQFSSGMFGGTGPAAGTGTGGGYAPFDIDKISPGFLKDAAATNKKLKLLYLLVRRRRPAHALPEEGGGGLPEREDRPDVQELSGRPRVARLAQLARGRCRHAVPVDRGAGAMIAGRGSGDSGRSLA